MNVGEVASTVECRPGSVIRRIGAMIYDMLLLIAVLLVATIPFTAIFGKQVLIPSAVGWFAYLVYLFWQVLVVVLFFGFFWTRRGQTLGMQVWRLRVEDEHGQLLSWRLVIRRLLFAALPWLPGYIVLIASETAHSMALKWSGEALLLLVLVNLMMARFSPSHRTWHDRMARSRVVMAR
ncbi:MAG TPA: RDD family protein [Steroidobacteraceae bacterium]|nr:RDD family protein [Steroidobacteraceae bacterium]